MGEDIEQESPTVHKFQNSKEGLNKTIQFLSIILHGQENNKLLIFLELLKAIELYIHFGIYGEVSSKNLR
jgi:hypothetical protein